MMLGFVAGIVLALVLVWLRGRLFGFAAQRPADYAATAPEFDIRAVLNGPIACDGVIYGPTGRVVNRFVAQMQADWDGEVGTMTEAFHYASGSRQDRRWTLTLGPDGTIRAEAADVVGVGTGRQQGAGVMLRYRLRLPEASGGHVLDVVDWMYLTQNGTIINRSQMRKFGVLVAELVAVMRKEEG